MIAKSAASITLAQEPDFDQDLMMNVKNYGLQDGMSSISSMSSNECGRIELSYRRFRRLQIEMRSVISTSEKSSTLSTELEPSKGA